MIFYKRPGETTLTWYYFFLLKWLCLLWLNYGGILINAVVTFLINDCALLKKNTDNSRGGGEYYFYGNVQGLEESQDDSFTDRLATLE